MLEKTLAIIKPHAVASHATGMIINIIELNKFSILGMEKLQLSRAQGEQFYDIHKEKPFFNELVENIIAGPVVVMTLSKENAIQEWRDLMGATNPEKANVGTIRKMFGTSISFNASHGSDAPETAKQEVKFFFPNL